MTRVSVVVPVKDERDNLRPLCARVAAALEPADVSYEIVFVDDGSLDGSFAVLEELAATDPRVKAVRLRRNFGQTAALQAGIDFSSGDIVVTMDGDLQNDPADIPKLLDTLDTGYDAVFGLRARRQDALVLRKVPSWIANWVIRKVTGSPVRDMGCTLRALRRDLALALPLYGEMHRFVPVLCQQQGARVVQIPVAHHPRTMGQTKYGSLSRTPRVVLDLITITFLGTYLTRPMHAFGMIGLASMGLGALSLAATVAMKYLTGGELWMTRNPFLLLSAMLEIVGVQFLSIGLLGELLTRTYFESQGKTPYAVRSTVNLDRPVRRHAA